MRKYTNIHQIRKMMSALSLAFARLNEL